MAIVDMSKIRLIGLKDEREKIMEILTRSHCFEIKKTDLPVVASDDSAVRDGILAKQSRIGYAIEYLQKQNDAYEDFVKEHPAKEGYVPIKKQGVRPFVSADELFGMASREAELLSQSEALDSIAYERAAIANDLIKCRENINAVMPYAECNIKFSAQKDTKKSFLLLFNSPIKTNINFLDDIPTVCESYPDRKYNPVAVIGLLEDKAEIVRRFGEKGFTVCPFSFDKTAGEYIAEQQQQIEKLKADEARLYLNALDMSALMDDFKRLYDYYALMCERYSAEGAAQTDYTVIIEGWCPTVAVDKIKDKLTKNTQSLYFEACKPEENDLVPTYTRNSKLIEPFEDLTLMYTVPDYRDTDPNPFMSFWYFFIFGMMTGDFVYGVLITLACVLMLRLKKPERGLGNMLKMFAICGVSSALWGVMYGSFMGFSISVPEGFFLSYSGADGGNYLGWFNPMEQPIKLLGISLIVGILHMFFGYAIKFVMSLKDKQIGTAILDVGVVMLILLAIAAVACNIFAEILIDGVLNLGSVKLGATGALLQKIGLFTLLGCIVVIFFTAGRASLKKRKIGGYLGGGLNGVYGLVNLLADMLSYSRIFGLGLAGAAIAYAFNTLVQSIFYAGGNVVMIAIGSILLLVLHVFNLAIGILGTYVHNARLQFLEFYGKFLTGDGKLFSPLGEKTKYVRMN